MMIKRSNRVNCVRQVCKRWHQIHKEPDAVKKFKKFASPYAVKKFKKIASDKQVEKYLNYEMSNINELRQLHKKFNSRSVMFV